MARKKYKTKFSIFGRDIAVRKARKKKVSFMGLKVKKRKQGRTLSSSSRITL